MNTNAAAKNITRQLVTSWADNTPLDGFTVEANAEGGWAVSDGWESTNFEAGREADALRTYADFIETFADDQDEATKAEWLAEIAQARSDADAISSTK